MPCPPDIRVQNHGSVLLLVAATPRGRDWLVEHLDPGAPRWGTRAWAVEPRYAPPILDGAVDDGLWVA